MNPWLWVRCVGLGVVMVVGFLIWYRQAYPGMPHGIPMGTLALGVVAMPAVIVAQTYLLAFVPTRISVSAKRIHISHGQSGVIIKPGQLISAVIEFDEQERALLRISYRMRPLRKKNPGRERTRVHAIGPKVDLVRLDELLAELLSDRVSGEIAAMIPGNH